MSTIHTKKMNRTKVWTSQSKSIAAFTLVELLTVIAIIAILSAIIFPVYNNSREAARRTTAVSNLAKIQNAMEQYKLDHRNRDYPPVLFAYADGTHSMADIKNVGSAESWAAAHPGVAYPLQGLYPQYINDASVFTDPNNTDKSVAVPAMMVEFNREISGFCEEIAYWVAAYSSAPNQTLR